MRKIVISVVVAVAMALVGFGLSSAFTSNAADNKPASNRVLTGEYLQTNDTGSAYFSGQVTDGKIKIVLRLDSGEEGDSDAAGTYWVGSFDTSNISDTFNVVSTADPKEMEYSILASQDDTKNFTYKNGDLSFKFTMMGATTTVHLSK